MENKDLKYTFIIGAEAAKNGAVLPFIGVPGMTVEVPAGACNGQRVPLTGNGKNHTVKLQICDAKYRLFQKIYGTYLHDSLLIEHRDKKHMTFATTMLLSLVLLFCACTFGVEMLIIGYPMIFLVVYLPIRWVRFHTNRARAKVELEDRATERQKLIKDV